MQKQINLTGRPSPTIASSWMPTACAVHGSVLRETSSATMRRSINSSSQAFPSASPSSEGPSANRRSSRALILLSRQRSSASRLSFSRVMRRANEPRACCPSQRQWADCGRRPLLDLLRESGKKGRAIGPCLCVSVRPSRSQAKKTDSEQQTALF